jgi:hypothetical protein
MYEMASCRACGGESEPIALCTLCEEDVKWKCASCRRETDVSIHTHNGSIVEPKNIGASKPRARTSVAAAT